MKKTKWIALACVAGLVTAMVASAQQNDALLDKLIEKGVLTPKEAKQLREESDKDFATALSAKTGMPDWVKGYMMTGDLRLRFEQFNGGGANVPARDRFRYRLRYGIVANLTDDWTVGFRLASGDTTDPISTNETMDDNGERDTIAIDRAYAMWAPNSSFMLSLGKIPNPFKFDPAIIDPDYNPEGFAANYSFDLTDSTKLGFTAGGFILSESSSNSQDGYAGLLQLLLSSKLNAKLNADLGVGTYAILNRHSVTTQHANRGNTYSGGAPLHEMNPIIVDAALTYKLDSFPGYTGAFPVSIGGTYINNPGANEKNQAFMAGITLGKASKAKDWSFSWQYRQLEADSLYDQWTDSDFGGYGVGGTTTTYKGGTDARGNVFAFNYMLSNSWTFAADLFLTEAITTSSHVTQRFRFDLIWKF